MPVQKPNKYYQLSTTKLPWVYREIYGRKRPEYVRYTGVVDIIV